MRDTLWVFGYGSLLWDPGFPVAQKKRATLRNWHRSFCMWSIHHRGTPETPGLVLALDRSEGASCEGVAFAVQSGAEDETLSYLRERELVSSAYLEIRENVVLNTGEVVEALTYAVDPEHEQYTGPLALEEQAKVIAGATGGRGPNPDYLWNTARHLDEIGVHDDDITWLAERVRHIVAPQTRIA